MSGTLVVCLEHHFASTLKLDVLDQNFHESYLHVCDGLLASGSVFKCEVLVVHKVNMTYLVCGIAVSVLLRLVATATYADMQHSEARTPKSSLLFPLLLSH